MTPGQKIVRRMWTGYVPNGKELDVLASELSSKKDSKVMETEKPPTQ